MLEVKRLNKSFGQMQAVNDLSFQIEDGQILGLIGQNGAGKTTTFRMILGLMQADQGEVLWNGEPIGPKHQNLIGYLPEERGLYPKETVEHQIIYFGNLRGIPAPKLKQEVDAWLEKFAVKGKKSDKIKSLSKGNQQKVQLITTLIHRPKLVILDEPFSGLDPLNADIMKQAILELKKAGACVIFSSHNMANVEELCDQLLMIKDGKEVLAGMVTDIRESFGRIKVFLEAQVTLAELEALPYVEKVKEKQKLFEVTLTTPEAGKELFKFALKDDYIATFSQQPLSLEEIFKLKAGQVKRDE